MRNPPLILDRENKAPVVPDAFEMSLFADKLDNPRHALVLPNGDLAVASEGSGTIFILRDADKDGRAEWIERFAAGFNKPNGIAHREGELLVADRDLEIGPDGRLYVGVASAGNLGVEPEPQATIQRFSAEGEDQTTIASSVRNPVGLAFHPATGELWATVQERGGFGDQLVPDYLIRVQEGGFYGWPLCLYRKPSSTRQVEKLRPMVLTVREFSRMRYSHEQSCGASAGSGAVQCQS